MSVLTLLIDAGNTRIKWATFEGLPCLKTWRKIKENSVIVSTLNEAFTGMASDLGNCPQKIIVSNVRSNIFEKQLNQFCYQQDWCLPYYVRSRANSFGVKNAYSKAEQLGVDRFVALIYAKHYYSQQHCLLIDCGTAITIDALLINGQHLGGLILPGLALSSKSLIEGTTGIHNHLIYNHDDKFELFSKETKQAVTAGSYYGSVAAIDGICEQMELKIKRNSNIKGDNEQYDILANKQKSIQRLLCGGDAKLVWSALGGQLQDRYHLQKNLIIMGLEIIAKRQWECVG